MEDRIKELINKFELITEDIRFYIIEGSAMNQAEIDKIGALYQTRKKVISLLEKEMNGIDRSQLSVEIKDKMQLLLVEEKFILENMSKHIKKMEHKLKSIGNKKNLLIYLKHAV